MAIMGRGRLDARMAEQFVHGDEIAVGVVHIAGDGVMNVFVHERRCWHMDCLWMTIIVNDTYVVLLGVLAGRVTARWSTPRRYILC
jgi:hypothetical protein